MAFCRASVNVNVNAPLDGLDHKNHLRKAVCLLIHRIQSTAVRKYTVSGHCVTSRNVLQQVLRF